MDGMTLEKLQVIIDASIKPYTEAIKQVQNQTKKATEVVNKEVSKIKNLFKGFAKLAGTLAVGKFIKVSTTMAMKVEGAIQQIKRTMGESSNTFLKWSKDSALAFNMSQSDAMNFGATFSNLVSTFSSGTQQTMQYTTDLLKASSVIASGTGRTMTDVMERIRSGLLGNTEAIEDLGINVNVAMLESTDAFSRFANGKSWDQLNFQTQQQIRLFGILEQTSNKFGGAVFNNTNSSLQQLVAILKDVALNLGNAFLPILNIVLPILSNFAMGLRTVTAYVATFMQALFGKSSGVSPVVSTMNSAINVATNGANAQNGYNSALADTGDTAKNTAKEMSRLLGGFDEINSIKDSGADGGGASGAGGGIDVGGGTSVPTIETPVIDNSGIDSTMMALVNNIKAWFNSIDFSPLINSFNRIKESVAPIIDTIGNSIKWLLTDILAPLAKWTIEDALPAFFNLLAGALDVVNPVLESFSNVAIWLWDSFLAPIAAWTGGVIVDVLNGLADVLSSIGDWMSNNQSVVDVITLSVVGFFAAWKVTELLGFIGESGGVIAALQRIAKALFATTTAKIADKLETIALTAMYAKDFMMSIVNGTIALAKQAKQFVINTGLKIADKAETVALGALYVKDFMMSIVNGTIALAKQAKQFVINTGLKIADKAETVALGALYVKDFMMSIVNTTVALVKQAAQWTINTGLKLANTVATGAMTVATGIWNVVCGIATGVTWAFGAAVAFLTIPIGLVILAIGAVIAIVILLIKNWDAVKEVASNVWNKIKEIWSVVATWFYGNVIQPLANFFSGLWNSIVSIFTGVKDWFSNKFSEAWQAIKNVFSGVGSFFGGVWDVIKQQFTNIGSAIGNAIGGAFKYVVNSIISFAEKTINGFIWAINGAIGLINKIPGVSINTITPLSVPRLAKGGVLDSPTLAMVGEAGREAVVPLENNTGWKDEIGSMVANAVLSAMQFSGSNSSNSGNGDVYLQIDGTTFARLINPYQEGEKDRVGSSIILKAI